MHVLLGLLIVAVCLVLLSRAIQNARGNAWAGPRSTGMRSRATTPRSPASGHGRTAMRSAGSAVLHPHNGTIRAQARADAHKVWQQAMATDWLEQRRHERTNGGAGDTLTYTTPPTIRQRLMRLRPFTQDDPAAQEPAGNGKQPANGTSQPAAPGNGGPPARHSPPSAPVPPASTNGGPTVPTGTSTAAAEKMTEGIQEIYARAASGGINAKQEAVRAAHEAAVKFAGMMQMLSRTMSEPGSNYGPEITEPIAKAGTQFQAGAMLLSEADSNLETLANMTLREAAASPRQVPHHEHELSENGRH